MNKQSQELKKNLIKNEKEVRTLADVKQAAIEDIIKELNFQKIVDKKIDTIS